MRFGVYATLLPTGLVKVGRGDRGRAVAASTYFAAPVTLLRFYPVSETPSLVAGAERRAHWRLHKLRAFGGGRELFSGSGEDVCTLLDDVDMRADDPPSAGVVLRDPYPKIPADVEHVLDYLAGCTRPVNSQHLSCNMRRLRRWVDRTVRLNGGRLATLRAVRLEDQRTRGALTVLLHVETNLPEFLL